MKPVYIIFLFLLLCWRLTASHLIGGKITYRYLGANKYEYKLSVYRDCSDQVDFDIPAHIAIYDKANNSLVSNKALPLFSRNFIPPLSPNPCFIPPPGICVEIGVYIDTVQLSPNSIGYTIAYQRCCRNISVTNISLPSVNGITFTADIPPQINTTSQFNNFPPIYVCLSDTFYYSFASIDLDSDSLVYELCDLLGGGNISNIAPNPASAPPYSPILWSAGYTTTNQMPNLGGIFLNSQNGNFKFKPQYTGQFSCGICVSEYRNGVFLNKNRLEIQFNVVPCFLTSSIPTATNLCEGLTINFQNNSTNANGYHWDFGLTNITTDTSSLHTPTFTFPSYGTYTVSLIVSNSAYGFCKDTAKRVINVNPLLSPTLQPLYAKCFNNNNINFTVGGAYQPQTYFQWDLTPNSNAQFVFGNPISVHFTTPQTKTVSVIINQFGCVDTLQSIVSFSNPVASVNQGLLNCNEKALNFINLSNDATSYHWDFGVPALQNDTSNVISPAYIYSNYGDYTVTLIAFDGQCKDTLREAIHVYAKLLLTPVNQIRTQCFKNNLFNFYANGMYGSNAQFSWFIGSDSSAVTSNLENPANIHFKRPGTYLARLTLSENGCTLQRVQPVKVLPSPKAKVFVSDTMVCEPGVITFKQIIDTTLKTKFNWTINGIRYSDTTITLPFAQAGSFSFSVVALAGNGCTDTLKKNNYLKINPTPKANFLVEPFYSTVVNPNINFYDSTSNLHFTSMNFGDGASSTSRFVRHPYQLPGEYSYRLGAYNEFGCADTITGTIYIDDIDAKFIPNVFTPNNDNVNDHFFIKGESITASKMIIFNSWGGMVFENDDALKGWDGNEMHNGRSCSDGSYFYEISFTLDNYRKYKFVGTVQLIR